MHQPIEAPTPTEPTDIERFRDLFDETGVIYDVKDYDDSVELEIEALGGQVTFVFTTEGHFRFIGVEP